VIDIKEGSIVRLDDDEETPWLVVHIDEEDILVRPPASSRKVWIRKMIRIGKDIRSLPAWDIQDIIVSTNRLWVA
jgi:hypothetical protein